MEGFVSQMEFEYGVKTKKISYGARTQPKPESESRIICVVETKNFFLVLDAQNQPFPMDQA
jgi:hypothetical protein